jgi:hypothetical protein
MTEQVAPHGTGPRVGRRTGRLWTLWRRLGRILGMSRRWPVVAAFFIAASVLGWIGFDLSLAVRGQPASFLDKVYLTIQLFLLRSGSVPQPVSWQLEVARYLAPAVAAFATLSATVGLLGEKLSGLRVSRYSDHVVVCGLGRLGSLAANNLCANGFDVVAIESNPQNAAIGQCRENGIIVFVGDATDATLLRKARVDRARHLIAVTGDDGVNIRIEIQAARLVEGRHGPPLTCFVHVVDDQLAGVLRQVSVAQSEGAIRLEAFNAAERGAPALLRERPAFDDHGGTPLGPPHIVVVGMGQMGASLVVHAAQLWRSLPSRPGKRLKVTVVDNRADKRVATLNERLPGLKAVCDLVAHRIDLDSPEFERADFLFGRGRRSDVTGVYVCLGDDAVGLSAALHLRHRLGDRKVPIAVRTTREGGVASLLRGLDGGKGYGDLDVFGLLDLVCKPDVLLGGLNEVLARAIHERYVSRERENGRTPEENQSMVDWDRLPESLRESNRHQAADICRKLHIIGCEIEPLTDWEAALPEFSETEIEELARVEHIRWWKEREAGGWRLAAAKDEARKQSPYLVPYDDLPEDIKEYDRAAVRGIPDFLGGIGFGFVRVRPGPGPADQPSG